MFVIPTYPRRLSLFTALYLLTVFIWLTPEDNNVWFAVLLGVGMALLLILRLIFRFLGGRKFRQRWWFIGWWLLGVLIGSGTAITTAMLMLVKTSMHNHIYPDFPAAVLIGVLQRAPSWGAAGGLIGVAVALVRSGDLDHLRVKDDPGG